MVCGKEFPAISPRIRNVLPQMRNGFAYRAGSSIQWSKFGNDPPCSAVRLLQAAYEIRPIEQQRFDGYSVERASHLEKHFGMVCGTTSKGNRRMD